MQKCTDNSILYTKFLLNLLKTHEYYWIKWKTNGCPEYERNATNTKAYSNNVDNAIAEVKSNTNTTTGSNKRKALSTIGSNRKYMKYYCEYKLSNMAQLSRDLISNIPTFDKLIEVFLFLCVRYIYVFYLYRYI